MPKYRDYATFTRTVEVALENGDLLHIAFYPARYTADLREGAVEGAVEGKPASAGSRKAAPPKKPMSDSEFIVAVAAGWDWEDEDEALMPLTVEFLDTKVELKDRAGMVKAILESIYPNAGSGAAANTATSSSSSSA